MKIVSESLSMMSTAFGLVAALAWNEAIKSLIDEFVPKGKGVLSLFLYAVLVTLVVLIATSRLSKVKERLDRAEINK